MKSDVRLLPSHRGPLGLCDCETPNSNLFEPKAKTLLNEGYYPFDNVEDKIKIKGTIITYE